MSKRKKKVMVCVTQQKSCERLIAAGSSLRTEFDELHVIHVVKENWRYFGQLQEADALDYLFDIARDHDAQLVVLKSKDIEGTLGNYAEKNKVDTIVMGESLEKDAQQNMINRLQKVTSKNVKFHIVELN